MDWVLGNWLGVATAAIGIWVSWRLRTHPAIRYSFDRFSAGSFFATKRDYTSIRIKNTGTETIDQSHIREPIYAAFSVPCTSAVPTAATAATACT